jgi:hypothetical protein
VSHEDRRIAVLREELDREMVPLFAASIIAYHEISSDARELRDELSLEQVAHIAALALSSIAPIYASGSSSPATMSEIEALLRAHRLGERRSDLALHHYAMRRGDLRAAIQKLRAARVTLSRENEPSARRLRLPRAIVRRP